MIRCVCFGIVVLLAPPLVAAPNITAMPVRGLQIGGTTILTIQGSDLLPNPKLITHLPIAKQTVLEKPAANSVRIEVTLPADVTPGMYNLRLANDLGISNGVVIAVDKLPQLPLAEEIASTPAALHGSVTSSNIVRTSIKGRAGEEFLAEVEAARLGSKLRPVLHLYNSQRRHIALALPNPALHGDVRLSVKLPADDTYTLELHDLHYAGQTPGHFRLKVGEFQSADRVFPPALERGQHAPLQILGIGGDSHSVDFTAEGTVQPAPWPAVPQPSGTRPRVLISDHAELLEKSEGTLPQELPGLPVAVSGRLDAPRQEDVYRVEVSEGAKLRFEVFAERLGSPMDSLLELRNEKGGRLAVNDDATNTTDSLIDYTVPKGVSRVDVALKDQLDQGTEECIYRLAVTPLEGASKPRFTLKILGDTHNVPQNGTTVFQIVADRQGYEGPIQLRVDDLPPGISASATDIAAGSNGALMMLQGTPSEPAGLLARIHGQSVGLDPPISSTASVEDHPLGSIQPWMQHDLGLALAPANLSAFQMDWSRPAEDTPLVLGMTMKAPVAFQRPPGDIGPVRLSLLVGQPVPIVNNRPNVNGAVRAERATLDLPIDPKAKAAWDVLAAAEKALEDAKAKADKESAGPAKDASLAAVKAAQAKRDAAANAFREAEKNLKNEAEFNIIVPPDLAESVCDVALKAELRSIDNQTVLATVFTPVRRFISLNPLGLKLAGEPKLTAKLDTKAGAAVKLTGTIERKAGFAGDVTVSIEGQPAGVAAPKVALKPDQTEFELELKFPPNFQPGEIRTIQLRASGPPNPKAANIVVKAEQPIRILLEPAHPPEKKP